MSEEQIFGAAKLLGEAVIELNPLLPQLMDVYSVGVKKKVEFMRASANMMGEGKAPVVGRAICGLKFVGDYLSKFDVADNIERKPGMIGQPKVLMGEVHLMPPESFTFKWRIRCNFFSGMDLPLSGAA